MNFKTIIPVLLVMGSFGNPVEARVATQEELNNLCSSTVESSSFHHVGEDEDYIWCQSSNGYGFPLPYSHYNIIDF